MPEVIPNRVESIALSALGKCAAHAKKEAARNSVCTAEPSLTATPEAEVPMATILPNAWSPSAQDYTDPLIANARLVNMAAEIDRNLAARRAMRPKRSEAARKGWEARRGI